MKRSIDSHTDECITAKKFIKAICKYGSSCYRKNRLHCDIYDHPDIEENTSVNIINDRSSSLKKCDKINEIYLTKISHIKNNGYQDLSLSDILSIKNGKMVKSVQFNYMIDCNWLMSHYPKEFRSLPLLLVHGGNVDLTVKTQTNIDSCKADLPIPFGTHHTKMMLLLYDKGLRVVVHTANLVAEDWALKTQCIWMSPIFPLMEKTKTIDGDSATGFKRDLLEYLNSYNKVPLKSWIEIVQKYDFSDCNAYLICSSPGKHCGSKGDSFGHMKLRKVLSQEFMKEDTSQNLDLIAQFSSIGSLGPSESSWLTSEFMTSLQASKHSQKTKPKLHLIYPCVEDVKNSLEGYMAGGSLPYSNKVHNKQLWIRRFLRKWKANSSNRTRASPHMKSYACTSPDGAIVHWFIVTSANLSKAAWGGFDKGDRHLMIRSYEAGVLLLPKNYGARHFSVGPVNGGNSDTVTLNVPYDLPTTSYDDNDEPWMVDVEQRANDICGNAWYQ